MTATLPALANTSARRAEPSTSKSALTPNESEPASFEHTLQQSQRASRLRDQSRDVTPSEKPAEARREKVEKPREKPADAAPVDAAPSDAASVEPAETKPAAPAAEPVEVDGNVAQGAEETTEVAVEEIEEPPELATGDEAYAAAVTAVANDLSQQAATSIGAGTEVDAPVVQQSSVAAANEQTKSAAKPKAVELPAKSREIPQLAEDAEESVLASAASTEPSSLQTQDPSGDELNGFSQADGKGGGLHAQKVTLAPVESSTTTAIDAGAATSPTPPPSAPHAGPVTGESASAQFAQLPQADDASRNDDVNVGRLTRGLASAINQRGGSVTLRLTPPELGAVRIEMVVRDGAVNAKFTAQTESVRNLLMDQMSHLRQALDRQGLTVEKFEVQVMTQSSSSGGFDKQSDDLSRDGRSAGQYSSSQGGRGSRQPHDRRGVDTFDRAMADVIQ